MHDQSIPGFLRDLVECPSFGEFDLILNSDHIMFEEKINKDKAIL